MKEFMRPPPGMPPRNTYSFDNLAVHKVRMKCPHCSSKILPTSAFDHVKKQHPRNNRKDFQRKFVEEWIVAEEEKRKVFKGKVKFEYPTIGERYPKTFTMASGKICRVQVYCGNESCPKPIKIWNESLQKMRLFSRHSCRQKK